MRKKPTQCSEVSDLRETVKYIRKMVVDHVRGPIGRTLLYEIDETMKWVNKRKREAAK